MYPNQKHGGLQRGQTQENITGKEAAIPSRGLPPLSNARGRFLSEDKPAGAAASSTWAVAGLGPASVLQGESRPWFGSSWAFPVPPPLIDLSPGDSDPHQGPPDDWALGGRPSPSRRGHRQGRLGRGPLLLLVGVLGSLAPRGQAGDLWFLEPGAPVHTGFPRTSLAPGEGVCLQGELVNG